MAPTKLTFRRYGQKHDVVVVNFVNQENAADKRVYELLKKRLQGFRKKIDGRRLSIS